MYQMTAVREKDLARVVFLFIMFELESFTLSCKNQETLF